MSEMYTFAQALEELVRQGGVTEKEFFLLKDNKEMLHAFSLKATEYYDTVNRDSDETSAVGGHSSMTSEDQAIAIADEQISAGRPRTPAKHIMQKAEIVALKEVITYLERTIEQRDKRIRTLRASNDRLEAENQELKAANQELPESTTPLQTTLQPMIPETQASMKRQIQEMTRLRASNAKLLAKIMQEFSTTRTLRKSIREMQTAQYQEIESLYNAHELEIEALHEKHNKLVNLLEDELETYRQVSRKKINA